MLEPVTRSFRYSNRRSKKATHKIVINVMSNSGHYYASHWHSRKAGKIRLQIPHILTSCTTNNLIKPVLSRIQRVYPKSLNKPRGCRSGLSEVLQENPTRSIRSFLLRSAHHFLKRSGQFLPVSDIPVPKRIWAEASVACPRRSTSVMGVNHRSEHSYLSDCRNAVLREIHHPCNQCIQDRSLCS